MSWWFLGQVWNWVTWCQKLGHQAKPAENLVNTLAVTFLKQLSWILLKMFVLMSSRICLKLGHLGSKTRSPGKSAENLVNTLAVTFLKQSSWIWLKMFVLMISRSSSKLEHLGSKTRSPGLVFFKQSSWILHKMFVLTSSRSSSKLGHLVSKTRSPGQISRKLCYNHFELWSECLPWSVLDQALKVLCCSGERYRAIMALLFIFSPEPKGQLTPNLVGSIRVT